MDEDFPFLGPIESILRAMTSRTLEGCRAKLKRAFDNLWSLYELAGHYVMVEDPYTITFDYDGERSEIVPIARNVKKTKTHRMDPSLGSLRRWGTRPVPRCPPRGIGSGAE